MNIETNQEGSIMTLKLEGRLDTSASPLLEEAVKNMPPEVTQLVLDCSKLEYISSSGLRMFLAAHKKMSKKDGLVLTDVNSDVRDILEVTGFLTYLDVRP